MACTTPSSTTAPDASTHATVGSAGGSLVLADGTRVDVPAGALDHDVTLTGEIDRAASAARERLFVSGPIYHFGPDGLTFAKPVTLTIGVDAAKLPAGRTVADASVYTSAWSAGDYAPLASSQLDATHVRATTTHFSWFTIGVTIETTTPEGDAGGDAGTDAETDATITDAEVSDTGNESGAADTGSSNDGAANDGAANDGGQAADAGPQTTVKVTLTGALAPTAFQIVVKVTETVHVDQGLGCQGRATYDQFTAFKPSLPQTYSATFPAPFDNWDGGTIVPGSGVQRVCSRYFALKASQTTSDGVTPVGPDATGPCTINFNGGAGPYSNTTTSVTCDGTF